MSIKNHKKIGNFIKTCTPYFGTEEMDWMYNRPEVDREEYLLGRKLDKAFDHRDVPADKQSLSGACLMIFKQK